MSSKMTRIAMNSNAPPPNGREGDETFGGQTG